MENTISEPKVALISGATRGMGYEAARQLAALGMRVNLGSRDPERGEKAIDLLRGLNLKADLVQLDVSDSGSMRAAVEQVLERHGRIDVLVNNAGVWLDRQYDILSLPLTVLHETLNVNLAGQLFLAQQVIPHMKKNGYGRIVNVSSRWGQLSSMFPGHPAYKLSKAALNALTILLAAEVKDINIKINSASPGWVRTVFGGPNAARSVEEGTDTTIWLATLPDDGPNGGFFHDRQAIDW